MYKHNYNGSKVSILCVCVCVCVHKYHTIQPVDAKISDLANNNFIKHLPLNVCYSDTFHLVSRNSNCCST